MSDELIISNTTELLRVQAQDVMCIKADGNYSSIVLNDGEECVVGFQLGQLEQLIDDQLDEKKNDFIRIGRGAIVNRRYLFRISLPKQLVALRSSLGHKVVLQASKDALRLLKQMLEESVKPKDSNG